MKLKIHVTLNDGSATEQTIESSELTMLDDGFAISVIPHVEIWSDVKEMTIKPVETNERDA